MKQITMAPMEGVTDYIYRNHFQKYFGGVDRYYTPFLSPNETRKFTTREWNDIDPSKNDVSILVPQLLTNNADHFIWACEEIKALGYREVNLNLGCPSGTVVAKKKGSGFLSYPVELQAFLDQIFSKYMPEDLRISIKTRLGRLDPDEFYEILEIYNQFPIAELTIHPRIQKDFYKEPVRMEYFAYAYTHSKNPLCYNGECKTVQDVQNCWERYDVPVMLGRGLIGNPFLAEEIKGIGERDLKRLKAFLEDMLVQYQEVLSGEKAVLCRMKEFWHYLLPQFTNWEAYEKRLRKTQRIVEYKAIASEILLNQGRS